MYSLKEIEHSQPDVLAICIDEQWCSLWISGLGIDLYDLFDIEGCRCKVNKFGLNGRDYDDCLLPALPNNWTAG